MICWHVALIERWDGTGTLHREFIKRCSHLPPCLVAAPPCVTHQRIVIHVRYLCQIVFWLVLCSKGKRNKTNEVMCLMHIVFLRSFTFVFWCATCFCSALHKSLKSSQNLDLILTMQWLCPAFIMSQQVVFMLSYASFIIVFHYGYWFKTSACWHLLNSI